MLKAQLVRSWVCSVVLAPAMTVPAVASRLAVIDTGEQSSPGPLLDLVFAELAGHSGVELVERSEIRALLQERALRRAFGDPDALEARRDGGRLLAADGLLALEALPTTDAGRPVRLHLIETRAGLELWRATVLVEDPNRIPKIAAELVAHVGEVWAAHARGGHVVVPVAVGAIQSREQSRRWDFLTAVLEDRIAVEVGVTRGVILAERQRVRPLLEERDLVADLPESIAVSAIRLSGDYTVRTSDGLERVALTLRAGRAGTKPLSQEISGTIVEVPELTAVAARELIERLAPRTARPEPAGSEVSIEAELLGRVAEAHLLIAESTVDQDASGASALDAVRVAESAIALDPRGFRAHALLMRAVNGLLDSRYYLHSANAAEKLTGDEYELFRRSVLPAALRAIDSARRSLEHPQFPSTQVFTRDGPHFYERDELLRQVSLVFLYPDLVLRLLGEDARTLSESLRPSLLALYEAGYRTTAAQSGDALDTFLLAAMYEGSWMTSERSQAVALVRQAIERAVSTHARQPSVGVLTGIDYSIVQSLRWDTDDALLELYRSLLEELSTHEHAAVRAYAERGLAGVWASVCKCCGRLGGTESWHGGPKGGLYHGEHSPRTGCDLVAEQHPEYLERAKEHYDRFIELLVEEVLPRYPQGRYSASRADGVVESLMQSVSIAYKPANLDPALVVERAPQVYETLFARGVAHRLYWREELTSLVQQLEKAGDAARAWVMLETIAAHLARAGGDRRVRAARVTIDGLMTALQGRHPELRSDDDAPATPAKAVVRKVFDLARHGELLVGMERARSETRLRSLVPTESGFAIVVGTGDAQHGTERYGVFRLTGRDFTLRGFQRGGETTIEGESANLGWELELRGPQVCTRGEDVFVGLPDAGVVWFPERGEPMVLDEAAGLKASRVVAGMVVQGDKLYAIVGVSVLGMQAAGKGLLEIDLESGDSELLISSRGADSDGDLQRSSLISMAPGPGETLLINIFGQGRADPGTFGVHLYDPGRRQGRQLNRFLLENTYLEPRAEGTLLVDQDQVSRFSKDTDELEWLYLRRGQYQLRQQRDSHVFDRVEPPAHWRGDWMFRRCDIDSAGALLCVGRTAEREQAALDSPQGNWQRDGSELVWFTPEGKQGRPLIDEGLPDAARIVDIVARADDWLLLSDDALFTLRLPRVERKAGVSPAADATLRTEHMPRWSEFAGLTGSKGAVAAVVAVSALLGIAYMRRRRLSERAT